MPSFPDLSRIILIAGGLIGSLTMLAIRRRCPNLEVFLIDEKPQFGGALIMPVFEGGFDTKFETMIEALTVRRWNNYHVSTADKIEKRSGRVALISPLQIHAELLETTTEDWLFPGKKVTEFTTSSVTLTSGEQIHGDLVLDLRFRAGDLPGHMMHCTATERDVHLHEPHLLQRPVLIDTLPIAQAEGQNFLQYIPLDPNILRIIHVVVGDAEGMDFSHALNRKSSDIQILSTVTETFPISRLASSEWRLQSNRDLAALGLGRQFTDALGFADHITSQLQQGERRAHMLIDSFASS